MKTILTVSFLCVLFPACEDEEACKQSSEVCNGTDDNCNGEIDEGYHVDGSCTVGIGACRRRGAFICNPSGDASCDAQPGDPVDEVVCNAADDDCDGSVDEGTSCITFISDRQDGGIMIMPPDGGNSVQVRSADKGTAWDLAWSPLQHLIAFADSGIRVLNPVSGQVDLIVANDDVWRYRQPSWSHDEQRIAFAQFSRRNNPAGVNAINLANLQVSSVTIYDESQPNFSPDGALIAFVSLVMGERKIDRMNADERMDVLRRNVTHLTPEAGDFTQPAWSPDGTRILYVYLDDIWVMTRDGLDKRDLTNSQGPDGSPRWSPDGTKIVFETDRDGNGEIYVMDQDGGNPINLTQNLACDYGPDWSRVRQ